MGDPGKRLIEWRKPNLVGEAPRLGTSAVQVMTYREVRRFWSRIITFAVLTPFGLIGVPAIDGHWWKGNISGPVAATLATFVFAIFIALGFSIRNIYRDADARAQAINAKHVMFVASRTKFRLDTPLWKLAGLIGALSFVIAAALPYYVDFLNGMPRAPSHYLRRRALNELLEPYLPHGPVTGGVILAVLLMADLFLVFLFLKEVWRRIHSAR